LIIVTIIEKLYKELKIFCQDISTFLDFSLEEVKTIPLSVNDEFIQKLKYFIDDDFKKTSTKLKDIIPYQLFALDCSSKKDLKEILQNLVSRFQKNENYLILKVDIAIYMPICKLVYNKENPTSILPFIQVLETFHIYKVSIETQWNHYFFVFWIHFTKVLYPQSTQIQKPKLQYLTGFFKLLFHAYDPFSKEVQKWLETNTQHKNWNT